IGAASPQLLFESFVTWMGRSADIQRSLVNRLSLLRLQYTLALAATITMPASAQTPPGAAIFGRLMEKRMEQLAKDPAVAARAPGKRGMALMQAAGDSALYFLDDSGLKELGDLFAESGRLAQPEVWARLYTGGSDGFPDAFADMLSRTDSALVDRWSLLMVRVTRAGILRPPVGQIASSEEITKTIQDLIAAQAIDQRPRLRRGAAKTG